MASSRTPTSYDGEQATTSQLGAVRFATAKETLQGTSNSVAITPADLVLASTTLFDAPPILGKTLANAANFTTIKSTGLSVSEAVNGKQGVATLVAGTKVIANTSITANSRIFLTAQSLGTVVNPSALCVSARVVGASFTIKASQATDTSVIAYEIFEP
jgi:hypothetical protein